MKQITIISIIALVILGIIVSVYYFVISNSVVACPEDSIPCPDGITNAFRIPPTCKFEDCPGKNDCLEIGCDARDNYAGSINSDKYYECKCRWAKSVLPENLVCFMEYTDFSAFFCVFCG